MSPANPTSRTISPVTLIAAFAAVYIIWGSTYLAIRLAMETLPPFGMIGLRFGIAGVLMLAWAGLRGTPRPTARQLGWASVVGLLLPFGGTGAVVWATQYLDSGLVALLVAMEPLWMAVLMMAWPGVDGRPGMTTWAALGLGFAGAVLLAAPGNVLGTGGVHLPSLIVLMAGCLSWAGGSLVARNVELPASQTVNSGLQMLVGGAALCVWGALRGELQVFDPSAATWTSMGAFLYLIVFGSIVAFSAYTWLIRTVSPTWVSTHTYVNPVVAIFLGWLIANEVVGPRMLVASGLILGSVVLMTLGEAKKHRRKMDGERALEPESRGGHKDDVADVAERRRLAGPDLLGLNDPADSVVQVDPDALPLASESLSPAKHVA